MSFTIFPMSGFFDPVGQVPYKVKEEVAIRHADDLENQWKIYSAAFDFVVINSLLPQK